jgi:hypothetical protein
MTELKRWLDDNPPLQVGKLLRAARAEEPSPASLQHTLIKLGVSSAVFMAAGGAWGAGTRMIGGSLAKLAFKWGVVGASAGLVLATLEGVRQSMMPPSENAAAAASGSLAPRGGRALQETTPIARSSSVPPMHLADPLLVPRQAVGPAETCTPANSMPTAFAAERLAVEIALIDHARTSLSRHDPTVALRLLDEYERQYTEPHFAPEALYLRMQARALTGDRQLATRAARELVAKYPRSPQVGRAEGFLRSQADANKP